MFPQPQSLQKRQPCYESAEMAPSLASQMTLPSRTNSQSLREQFPRSSGQTLCFLRVCPQVLSGKIVDGRGVICWLVGWLDDGDKVLLWR